MTRPHGSTVAGKLKIIPTERSPRLFWSAICKALYLWVVVGDDDDRLGGWVEDEQLISVEWSVVVDSARYEWIHL